MVFKKSYVMSIVFDSTLSLIMVLYLLAADSIHTRETTTYMINKAFYGSIVLRDIFVAAVTVVVHI